jgi:hypothetical protein
LILKSDEDRGENLDLGAAEHDERYYLRKIRRASE